MRLTPVAFLWLAWPPSKEHSLFVPRQSSWFIQSTTPEKVLDNQHVADDSCSDYKQEIIMMLMIIR